MSAKNNMRTPLELSIHLYFHYLLVKFWNFIAEMLIKPPAHIRTKIDGIANELEEKRRDVKQTQNYINILIRAIKESWTIGKIKAELSKAKYVSYKGRTKYFDIVKELIGEY